MYFYGYRQHQPHAFVNKLKLNYNLKFVKNYSDPKVSHKCSSNYYHFSSSLTFIFVHRVFFGFFPVCEQLIYYVRHDEYVYKISYN